MKAFLDKEEYDQADIESLINLEVEESIHLDFKASGSLQKSDGKKTEIGKDVSAFANSDGGVIVYGITEADHKASEMSFIDGDEFTKEWLEQIINSKIQRRVPNILIFPIRFENDIKRSVYVVKIPRSNLAPHQNADKRFYKRYNFESVAMEEYEVRDASNRKQSTELEIDDILFQARSSSNSGGKLRYIDYYLSFQIRNIGNTIENNYKLEVHLPKNMLSRDYGTDFEKYRARDENNMTVFSIANTSPIYQEEVATIASTTVQIKSNHLPLLQSPGVKLKLYFTNGTRSRDFKLQELLTFEVKKLCEWQWEGY